jgi:hypothetical protein
MIRFEPGSVRYDREAQIFRFNASDDRNRIPCAISQAAFEKLARVKVDPDNARHIFTDWETSVFSEARQAYDRGDHLHANAIALGFESAR